MRVITLIINFKQQYYHTTILIFYTPYTPFAPHLFGVLRSVNILLWSTIFLFANILFFLQLLHYPLFRFAQKAARRFLRTTRKKRRQMTMEIGLVWGNIFRILFFTFIYRILEKRRRTNCIDGYLGELFIFDYGIVNFKE